MQGQVLQRAQSAMHHAWCGVACLAYQAAPCSFAQKIRTVELDGKVIKLQIVSLVWAAGLWEHIARAQAVRLTSRYSTPVSRSAVGHGGTGALPNHHQQLLPRRAWHHCGFRQQYPTGVFCGMGRRLLVCMGTWQRQLIAHACIRHAGGVRRD